MDLQRAKQRLTYELKKQSVHAIKEQTLKNKPYKSKTEVY